MARNATPTKFRRGDVVVLTVDLVSPEEPAGTRSVERIQGKGTQLVVTRAWWNHDDEERVAFQGYEGSYNPLSFDLLLRPE